MNKIKEVIIMVGIFSWLIGCNKQSNKVDYNDDKFKVGQIWKYNTRVGEENSIVKILKVEKYESTGIVIHISVCGLKVKNPRISNGFSDELEHLPFSKEAVLKSVTTLISENCNLPDNKVGYNNWKEAFDKNKAGIFSITIRDAIKNVEEVMDNAK